MHAPLGLQIAVSIIALDRERGGFDACLVPRGLRDDLHLEAAPFRPTKVHAQQHLGPILRVGAARARVDREQRVFRVVFAAELGAEVQPLDQRFERVGFLGQFVGQAFVAQFRQLDRVPDALQRFVPHLDVGAQPRKTAHGALRCLRIVPKVRLGGTLFEFLEFAGLCRYVKDAP